MAPAPECFQAGMLVTWPGSGYLHVVPYEASFSLPDWTPGFGYHFHCHRIVST